MTVGEQVMKTLPIIFVLSIVLALLSGCGKSGSNSGTEEEVVVTYTINADEISPAKGVICENEDKRTVYEASDRPYASVTCRWHCATYIKTYANGEQLVRRNKYVSLDFDRDYTSDYKWYLDHDYVSDGIGC